MPQSDRVRAIVENFQGRFGCAPEFVVRAPGRVNLIGEHTDYNDGFVFPAAIDRDILIAGMVRGDRRVHAYSVNFTSETVFSLDSIEHAAEPKQKWSDYLRGIAWAMDREAIPTVGIDCVAEGNVPVGAGLSSSAAMLVAGGLAFNTAADVEIDKVRLALIAQRAEREFVGVNVGIMDQFISALGRKDHALLIDTRNLTYEAVPLPKSGASIVIADTNKKRGLVDSEYNTRRAECELAVDILKRDLPGIKALRDVSEEEFARFGAHVPDPARRRARHVVMEDARTLESVTALRAGDLVRFGELMNASHESLRYDFEVSCRELDALVEAARAIPGVYGSRMTGAGFGGCTVSLVKSGAVDTFIRDVPGRYLEATGLVTSIYVTKAAQGAERIL